jgi:polar amino acid transport system permease protein
MNFSWFLPNLGLLLQGLECTILLIAVSGTLGIVLAIGVALGRMSRSRVVSSTFGLYTSVIRGTPLLVQIYILYYGLGNAFSALPWLRWGPLWPYLRNGFWYVALTLVLSNAAYWGELIRSGMRAIPPGELEAASAFGMGRILTLRRIWLPRTLRNLLPALAGETVMLMKATALASTVAVTDLLGAADIVRAQTFHVYEPLLLVAIVYLLLTYGIESVYGRVERGKVLRPGR